MVIRQEMWMHLLSRIYELVWIREKVYVSAYTKISANCLRLGAGPINLLLGDLESPHGSTDPSSELIFYDRHVQRASYTQVMCLYVRDTLHRFFIRDNFSLRHMDYGHTKHFHQNQP